MISIEKTRQALRSLNLTTIVLNAIFFGLSLLGLVSIAFILAMAGNPEFQAGLQSGMAESGASAAETQAVLGALGGIGIVLMVISAICPLVVLILAVQNRKKIEANQPSLLPYYIGGGVAIFNIISNLAVGGFNIIGLLVQGGLLVLYYFAIQKAKLLLENTQTDDSISS